MHRVVTTIREILPADLPKVDGKKATLGQLLDLGITLYDAALNLYSVREQENNHYSADPLAAVVPLVELKGKVIAEGPVQSRHDRLPAKLKVDLWRARVVRTKGTGKKKRIEIVEVDATEIAQDDEVVSAGIRKHRWAGESER